MALSNPRMEAVAAAFSPQCDDVRVRPVAVQRDALTDLGLLLLRLVLGGVVLCHGIAKIAHGLEPVRHALEAHGMPAWLAYGALGGEVLGPVLLIAGFFGRVGAALIAINMVVAIALVHLAQVFSLNAEGGWAIELQAMLLFPAIALVLTGPGRWSVNTR